MEGGQHIVSSLIGKHFSSEKLFSQISLLYYHECRLIPVNYLMLTVIKYKLIKIVTFPLRARIF